MRGIRNDKGFSLTELMLAMTILAIGLLALAQMQIMAMQGTTSSREFSTATNLARKTIEAVKITGVYVDVSGTSIVRGDLLKNNNINNDTEEEFAPAIDNDTDIVADLEFDTISVLISNAVAREHTVICGRQYPANCNSIINSGDWDFVSIVNITNFPPGIADGSSVMKGVNVIVLWKERERTRSVNLRTLVAVKDDDFF